MEKDTLNKTLGFAERILKVRIDKLYKHDMRTHLKEFISLVEKYDNKYDV